MGLFEAIKKALIKRELRKLEEKNVGKIRAVVEWLNAVPGRKRAIAAGLLGVAAILRTYGKTDLAAITEGANDVIQTYVVNGFDLVGFVMAVVGLVDAKRKGNL